MASHRAGLAALLALGVLTGCGVAPNTGVVADGQGLHNGVQDVRHVTQEAPERQATTIPKQFVMNYLTAAAGDPKGAVDRLRKYILPREARAWTPSQQKTIVVRPLTPEPSTGNPSGGSYEVTWDLQPIGTLNTSGTLEPLDQGPVQLAVVVTPDEEPTGRGGVYLSQPPSQVYLLESALTEYYLPYSIYFWDTDRFTLVPDRRYLSLALPDTQWASEVVRWVTAGPPPWLQPAVLPMPRGLSALDNVYLDGNRLVVNLSAQAADPDYDIDLLMAQLRWSLWDLHTGPIRLLIAGQPRKDDDSPNTHRNQNATARLSNDPLWFCIANGVVLARCAEPVPLLQGVGDNNNVVAAAVMMLDDEGLTGRYALVRNAAAGSRRLWLGQVGRDAKPVTVQTTLVAKQVSRPVWLRLRSPQYPGQGLVAADGRLYRIVAGEKDVTWLDVRSSAGDASLGGITAVAVAPDARRVALIANGLLYVAPVLLGSDHRITIGPTHRLSTTPLSALTGAAFDAQDRLVVAGREGGHNRFVEFDLDGLLEKTFEATSDSVVSQLTAYPEGPDRPHTTRGPVRIEAGGKAYEVYSATLQQIKGPVAPSAAPGKAAVVTGPFYVD